MLKPFVILVTGSRKGIGRYLTETYINRGHIVIGCSRTPTDYKHDQYRHFYLDVTDEEKVKEMMTTIRRDFGRIDVLINNAGIASMNHTMLTPLTTVRQILETNLVGTFLFCREASRLMKKHHFGRIINFSTVAVPYKLEGEAIYAASKAGVESLTAILARELANFGITVNAVGPTPVKTDLIDSIPKNKIEALLNRQAIHRLGEFDDIVNVVDFFMRPESNFVTGQIIYLGGA